MKFIAAILAAAAFVIPPPTGTFAVGTTSWRVLDGTRTESFEGDVVARQVEVLAWYPAAAARGRRAPYLREGVDEVRRFAELMRAPRDAFDHLQAVETHAFVDAPIAAAGGKFPLLIFSHGYGGFATASTALLEDLASHGYVVLSVVHPYEAGGATLADGRFVSFIGDDGKPRQGYLDVVGEWAKEDETMAAVTAVQDQEGQRRLLRGYFATIPNTQAALRRWVDDTKRVLEHFTRQAGQGTIARLAARADPARLGVFGHSMGGVTAAQFCVDDQRCKAGLNLDGIPQFGTMIDTPMRRPFLMVYSARPGRLGASDAIYGRSASPYIRVDVADTKHLDFSDMIFWNGPLRERGAFGVLDPSRAIAVTRTIVREYFDQTLRGRPSPLLAGREKLPEVTVR